MGMFLGVKLAKEALKRFDDFIKPENAKMLRSLVKVPASRQAKGRKPGLAEELQWIEDIDKRHRIGIQEPIKNFGARNFKKTALFDAEKKVLREAIEKVEGGRGKIKKLREAKKRLDATDNN